MKISSGELLRATNTISHPRRAMPADQKSFGDGNASSTARSQQSKQQSSDSYTRSAATDFSSIFRIPPPMKRLFDRFPLVTYPPNELPVRPKQQNTTFETEDVLYVFCTEEDAQNGRPSFNPGCLRWQVIDSRFCS